MIDSSEIISQTHCYKEEELMSATTFDTLKFIKRLRTVGMAEEQAEALSEAFQESQKSHLENLATKIDLKQLELKVNAQLLLLKWMMGFILAGVLALIVKAFFIQ